MINIHLYFHIFSVELFLYKNLEHCFKNFKDCRYVPEIILMHTRLEGFKTHAHTHAHALALRELATSLSWQTAPTNKGRGIYNGLGRVAQREREREGEHRLLR